MISVELKLLEYSQYNYRKCSRNLPAQLEECEVETFLSGIGDGAGKAVRGAGGKQGQSMENH